MRKHLSYANVIATLALFFAMSGTALAAHHYLINSTKQIKPSVLKQLKKTGPKGSTGAQGPAGPAGTPGKEGVKGETGQPGLSALSTLPSGQTESGELGLDENNGLAAHSLFAAVTFPIPLAEAIPESNVVFSMIGTPVTHCSGLGHAEKGFLCIYIGRTGNLQDPSAGNFEHEGGIQPGSGRFGFAAFWQIKVSAEAYVEAAWSVTAN